MIKTIVKDVIFLGQQSEKATPKDVSVAGDLLDTLRDNADHCVGMAANMIGVKKSVIAFDNPEIIKFSDAYEAEEGCLSLTGTHKTKRWKSIKVKYQNADFQTRIKTFSGWTAQIIQHEIDHCNGVVI